MPLTGDDASLTDVKILLTVVNTSLTGVKTPLTGVLAFMTGVKIYLTGVETILTGESVSFLTNNETDSGVIITKTDEKENPRIVKELLLTVYY